ncbi:scavenger mRNA decapping enzyme [Chiua virens]|nr:scavenger mRNA decapping enzyme [Chiua virens]
MISDTMDQNRNHLTYPYDIGTFIFERILDENPNFHFLIVLGTLPAPPNARQDVDGVETVASVSESDSGSPLRLPAILRIERTAFNSVAFTDHLSKGRVFTSTKLIGNTDIYSWSHGWLTRNEDMPDVQIRVIFPATEVHIQKYTRQERILVSETPALYNDIVKPYIDAFPASRTQWVRDILEGKAEVDDVLCRTDRFLIVPDMKWDPSGPISSLYLLAIVCGPTIRSLRDLRGGPDGHVGLLEEIREQAYGVVKGRWGLPRGALRMYIHYQPSYYHFHVHIVHAAQDGTMGMAVGQAHLLDDVISMLKYSPNILSEITLTYGLGSQHGLYDSMAAAQVYSEIA